MKEKIKEILLNNVDDLEGVELKDDLPLISGGYMDSFDIIGLIAEFEEAFHVSFFLDKLELEDFETVSGIENVIGNLQKTA